MPQQDAQQGGDRCLYVNPSPERRAAFEAACAPAFARLLLADGAQAALALLEHETADLLVIDLEDADPEGDAAALARLVAARAGAPLLVLCPFANARWLGRLMDSGPFAYALTPLDDGDLRAQVARGLRMDGAGPAMDAEGEVLAALRTRVRAVLLEGEDAARFGERLCQTLCAFPGAVHASLLRLQPGDDLRLEAQCDARGAHGLDLTRLLGRGERLLQSPLRHAFPGLLAVANDAMALLDRPDKAGAPGLAEALRAHGIAMAVGVPITAPPAPLGRAAPGPGTPRGAISLLFDTETVFSRARLAALAELAELAAIGLRLADLNRESEDMLARVTQLSTLDALTGVASRRHGETLLEQEIRRARRYHAPLALIAFDIDRFRDVNERYGNPVGDIVLRSVTQTVGALVRASDVLVRSGGEDFLVIVPHTSAIEGLKLAEKLRAAVEAAVVPGADRVTISLGVAQLGEQESADALTVRAHAALARAKRAGRNCVELAMQ